MFESEQTSLHRLWQRPLYFHQRRALDIVTQPSANAIVATGTGSGKTECFLIPLLLELLSEDERKRASHGVRAILLYPMNAFVEDQMARLRRLFFWLNLRAHDFEAPTTKLARPITFGRYTGETLVDENDRGQERSVSDEEIHELGELRFRREMQQAPPDILVTNFTMLEYMLLRNDDQRLFREPKLFKFLVLDEVHSYLGTTGMEVATLLRRLRNHLSRFIGKPANFHCVGTSATLGSEPDAVDRMAGFASTLFGTNFSSDNIVTGQIFCEPKSQAPFEENFDAIHTRSLVSEQRCVSKEFFLISVARYALTSIISEAWVRFKGLLYTQMAFCDSSSV